MWVVHFESSQNRGVNGHAPGPTHNEMHTV
jgi:hypothetical protein